MILKTSEMRTGNDSQTLKPCTLIHRWRRRAVYSTSVVSLVLIASFTDLAQAADSVNWNGSSSTDWFTNSNWSWDGHTPMPGDSAQIDLAAGPFISSGTNAFAGALFIGVNNSGSLDLDGSLATDTMTLGYNTGSSGTLTIDGGTLTNTGLLYVGNAGTGSIVMDNGTSASADTTYLGTAAGGSGTLTLDGFSNFTTNNTFFVGYGGDGTVTVSSGTLTTDGALLAHNSGTNGSVTVSGSGSDWYNTGTLTVGAAGIGSLDINTAGVVANTGETVIGHQSSGGTSTIVVDGLNSSLTSSDTLFVGNGGAATLTVSDNATVASGGSVIGRHSISSATVTGSGSKWTTGALQIGGDTSDPSGVAGDGTLTVSTGGEVLSTSAGLGNVSGTSGAATVTGSDSKWTITSGTLAVGLNGTGSLTISDGGAVTGIHTTIGGNSGGTGDATVTGSGSTLTNTGNLYVGNDGDGTLTVEDGGTVISDAGYVGTQNGSNSSATVRGSGSSWDMTSAFIAGYDNGSSATVTISEGGTINALQGTLGDLAGSTGSMTVTGSGSTWSAFVDGSAYSGYMNVGRLGTGSLTVEDGGSVTGYRLYIGNEAGSSGAVSLSGNGSLIDMTSKLFIGAEGDGTLTLSDGATLRASTIQIAYATGVTGTLNIGAASGETAGAAGTVDASEIIFGSGDGAIVLNHNDTDYTLLSDISGAGRIVVENGATTLSGTNTYTGGTTIYGGMLAGNADSFGTGTILNNASLVVNGGGTFSNLVSGSGSFEKIGSDTLFITGANNYTGATLVSSGTLSVNGSLSGSVTVSDSGTLGGSGTIGDVSVLSGGTLAPGNSIGTLTTGDVTFASGSTYEVEVDADGNSDKIVSTGAVTINSGSAISILPENGTDDGSTYDPYTTYTLITADNGVFGTFGAVSDVFAFLDVNLSYDVNNVYLALLRNNMDFTSIAETQNQIAVAGVVEAQGTAGALYRAVLPLTEDGARDAFDQLSGEVYTSTQSMLLDDSRFVREAILSHIHVMPTITSNSRDAAVDQNEKYAVWGAPFGAWGDWDGDGNAASLDRSIGGVVAGCDVMLGSSWTTGFAFGYSKTDFDVDSRLSSGSADGYHLGTYALKQLGGLDLTAGAAYSWHQVDTDRTVQFSGFRDDLKADYDADASQFFGEASYNFTTQTGRISPFLNLAYVHLSTDSFTEQGGEAALQVDSSSQDMVYSTLGLRAEKQIAVGGVLLKPNGSLGWRHGFGDNVPTGDVAFESGNAFAVEGVSIARNAIVGEFGLAHDLTENASINVAYNGQFSSDLNDQGVKATFVVKF